MKWRFSDSKTALHPGGFVRPQTEDDLPTSQDVSATQVGLTRGAIRQAHWHNLVSSYAPSLLSHFSLPRANTS